MIDFLGAGPDVAVASGNCLWARLGHCSSRQLHHGLPCCWDPRLNRVGIQSKQMRTHVGTKVRKRSVVWREIKFGLIDLAVTIRGSRSLNEVRVAARHFGLDKSIKSWPCSTQCPESGNYKRATIKELLKTFMTLNGVRYTMLGTKYTYNLLFPPSSSSAPAPEMLSLPVSLTFCWKTTVLPSFHISVMRVWPGSTTPAKRTLMFLNWP